MALEVAGLELCTAGDGQQPRLEVCVFLLEVVFGQVVQRHDPAVPQLPVEVLATFFSCISEEVSITSQCRVVIVTILHRPVAPLLVVARVREVTQEKRVVLRVVSLALALIFSTSTPLIQEPQFS